MTATRDAELASALLDLRAPLSRIELAASRLDREERTPRTGELARTIREAVAAADHKLELALRVLAPPAAEPALPAAGVLEELALRLRPVLAARGLELRVHGEPSPALDPAVLRRAAIALAGTAAELAEAGPVELRLVSGEGRWGVEACWSAAAGEGAALRRLRPLALLCGGEACHTDRGAVFWMSTS